MKITEAEQLVGQTFKRGPSIRTITRIEGLQEYPSHPEVLLGDVYWKRPGGSERKNPQWMPDFLRWLSKATEVQPDVQEAVK
mgnify:CR=1 FL=1